MPKKSITSKGICIEYFFPLVVTAENNDIVVKSAANIPGVLVTFANLINVYDILNAKKLVVDKAALAKIEEVFA